MTRMKDSGDSLAKASESTDEYSGHGDSLGAGGIVESAIADAQDILDKKGESEIISPPEGGFGNIHIGLAWNNIIVEKAGGFMGLLKRATRQGVDLDLGCFFILKDGTRGILQPFGNLHGNLHRIPYIELSEDERTGDKKGDDEFLTINGAKWGEIEKVLVYTYIYEGATDWSQIQPEMTIDLKIKGEPPLSIRPKLKTKKMTVCALASLTNIKDGIRITTHGEYFTSQASMDRAFGFGLDWEDGAKN